MTAQVIAPFSDRKMSHGDSFCFVKKTFVDNLIGRWYQPAKATSDTSSLYKRTCIHSLVLVVEREDSNGRFTDSKLLVLLVPCASVPNYDFSAPFIATTYINEHTTN